MHCKQCNTSKDDSAFYVSNKTRCKDCVKASVTANRNANIERVRAYDKMRASMPHRVAARYEYAKTPAYAKSHEAASLRWAAKHPERRKASHLVGNALRDGKLFRQPCWVCGKKAQAHHPDYSRPLDVVWLCPPHHKETHQLIADPADMRRSIT